MKRLTRENSKRQLLTAALLAANQYGFVKFTRDNVAEFSGKSSSLIAAYYPTMTELKTAVMKKAVECRSLKIIAEGLITDHPVTMKINKKLTAETINFLRDK